MQLTSISVRQGNIFPVKWEFFSYNTSAKNIYIHFIHYHNRSKCNLLTKNLNYSFSLCTISKDDIMKVFYCPWISNRSKTLTKHKIKLTCVQIQENWAIFLQVCVLHFEYWFSANFFGLIACQNKICADRDIFCIWTHGNVFSY